MSKSLSLNPVADYYQILEIDRNANSTEIRMAYKRLAMQYHPDRNAGDKSAEEHFKLINEAYHVLSDSLKKSRYDAGINPNYKQVETEAYWHEVKRRKYYTYRRAQQSSYRIDKEYFRVQALAFAVFLFMSGLCYSIIYTVNYFIDQKQAAHWRENTLHLKKVHALFEAGEVEEAFIMIKGLRKREPLEFRFNYTHDSLISEVRKRAENEFNNKNFKQAVYHYTIVKKEENPVRLETLQKLATCQYYLGEYGESLQALKHLLNQQPWNLELIYQIGMINLEKMDNKNEALHYLTLGKTLFKKNLSEVYGTAFEIVMDPTDVPDIYFSIFEARARTNQALGDYREAITDCNWAISLRKNEPEPYRLRAVAKASVRNYRSACEDLTIASSLGLDVSEEQRRYCR